MSGRDEEQLAELLEVLRPPPEAWVRAAQEIPLVGRQIDELVERALADRAFRERLMADLEAALADAGLEPDRLLVEALRDRLGPL